MKLAEVRKFALSLPEVTEQPHFNYSSFRVATKIFVTVPPDNEHIHAFVSEPRREAAIAMYPDFVEKLTWGGKVVGLRITLANGAADVIKDIIADAWTTKAPKRISRAKGPGDGRSK